MKEKGRDMIIGCFSAFGIFAGVIWIFQGLEITIKDFNLDVPELSLRFFGIFQVLVALLVGLFFYNTVKLSKIFSRAFIITLIFFVLTHSIIYIFY